MSSEEDVFEENDAYESEDIQYIEEESEEDLNKVLTFTNNIIKIMKV